MRVWRASDGFVVDLGPSPHASVSSLAAELPEGPWREPHDYVGLDSVGNITNRWPSMTSSVQEVLCTSVFAVVDGALRNVVLVAVDGASYRVERQTSDVVCGLQQVANDDPAIDVARRALAREDRRHAEAAKSRLEAVPGCRQDYNAGDDFRTAQQLLGHLVASSDHALEAEMLRALVRFGALRGQPLNLGAFGSFQTALDAFVLGCRRAAFDRTLPDSDPAASQGLPPAGEFAALPPGSTVELRGLVGTLRDLDEELLLQAEAQEWSDALLNAAELEKAAAHVRRAREILENGFR